MNFFGLTLYGPQNYVKDILREDYIEPLNKEESRSLLTSVSENSTCPKNVERPSIDVIRLIDCYMGRVNGFPYGSMERLDKMKRKGVIKPVGPQDMYRFTPTTSTECGWWLCDPALTNATWTKTCPRFPQPMSPNTKILDIVRKNDKYATFF